MALIHRDGVPQLLRSTHHHEEHVRESGLVMFLPTKHESLFFLKTMPGLFFLKKGKSENVLKITTDFVHLIILLFIRCMQESAKI